MAMYQHQEPYMTIFCQGQISPLMAMYQNNKPLMATHCLK